MRCHGLRSLGSNIRHRSSPTPIRSPMLCFSTDYNGPVSRQKAHRFSVDRTGLIGIGGDPLSISPNPRLGTGKVEKEPATPLAVDLSKYLSVRGPISISEYMLQALNHMTHGYYQSNIDKIGKDGDFITSPEISQIFGECVAIWCISTWNILGSPPAFNLVKIHVVMLIYRYLITFQYLCAILSEKMQIRKIHVRIHAGGAWARQRDLNERHSSSC